MTKVINLFIGSGAGKTTTAADLFSEMKYRDIEVELVSEYVKSWSWEGKIPNVFDSVHLLGEQSHRESILYHKVDYIVTDSPMLLAAYYEKHHFNKEIVFQSILNFLDLCKEEGIEHLNFFLKRNKKFNEKGRYENEQQALFIDRDMKNWLNEKQIPFTELNTSDRERFKFILDYLGIQ